MKKICFVTTVSYALKAFVIDFANFLYEKEKYEITFICNYDEEFSKTLPTFIKYIPISMNRGISFTGFTALIKMIHIFRKEKFDLVQYSTPNASLYASVAAKVVGIPSRLYCQWGIIYTGFSGYKRLIFKFIEKIICSFSTWIEPDSFGNLKFSQKEGLYNEKKSSVVWNGSACGVNLKKFNYKRKLEWRKEIRYKYGISDEEFVIGFVGRITRDKGINELLLACKKVFIEVPNLRVLLIGNMDKQQTIDQQLLNWSFQEERIIYCGATNVVEQYFSAMDIFVLPSYREGFGSVVIEAEAMGVPVIVSNIPGPTDAMIPNETGIVIEKENIQELYNAIMKLISNKKVLHDMGISGSNFVHNKFNQLNLFEYLLDDRKRLLKN